MNKNEMYAKFVPPIVGEVIGETRVRYFACNSLLFAASMAVATVVATKLYEQRDIAHLPDEVDAFLADPRLLQRGQEPGQEAA